MANTESYPRQVMVRNLVPGDMLDLENDPIAQGPCSCEEMTGERCPSRDEDGKRIEWKYSYGVVDTIEWEEVDCVVIYFDGTTVCAFPPDHPVLVVGHVDIGPESAKVYQ